LIVTLRLLRRKSSAIWFIGLKKKQQTNHGLWAKVSEGWRMNHKLASREGQAATVVAGA